MEKKKHNTKKDGIKLSSFITIVARSTQPHIEKFISSYPTVWVKFAECSPEKTVLALYANNQTTGLWDVMDIRSRGTFPDQRDLFSYSSAKELQPPKRNMREDPAGMFNIYLKVIK